METAVDKSWVSECKCADVIPHVGVNALLEGRFPRIQIRGHFISFLAT